MTIPILRFDQLKVVTMVIITVLGVQDLNLPAIFALLPVTSRSFGPGQHLQRKQGKVKFSPDMNVPGEILSMRYNKHVRGIIRSEETKCFPHTIILDIGTSARIVSVKLAKTIELTGPPSFDIAREAVSALIEHIRNTQIKLECIQKNPEQTLKIAHEMVAECQKNPAPLLDRSMFANMETSEIQQILVGWVQGYPLDQLTGFLNFILSLSAPLYVGKLELGPFESEMINVSYELGFPINRMTMVHVMNTPPFTTSYNNAQSARTVKIRYRYTKKDRTTGKHRDSHHTITVNPSGYITHSGPNFESMEAIYYTFMRIVLQNLDSIQSAAPANPRKIKYKRTPKVFSLHEYEELLQKEAQLREDIIMGRVPLLLVPPEPEPVVYIPIPSMHYVEQVETQVEDIPTITFDYRPLLAGMV